jgi:TolB-like protein
MRRPIRLLQVLDMSEKHDQEYFENGMAKEIIDPLVKILALKVIGRRTNQHIADRSQKHY